MPLDSRQRRALAARANRLKPVLTIAAGELDEAAIRHVREAFRNRGLIKLRVQSDSHEQTAHVAEQLARRVPCEIVQQVGRVLVALRRGEQPGATAPAE